MRGDDTLGRIATNFCTGVGVVHDVITCADLYYYRLPGLGVAGGQILVFSIDVLRCPYNTFALPVRVCDAQGRLQGKQKCGNGVSVSGPVRRKWGEFCRILSNFLQNFWTNNTFKILGNSRSWIPDSLDRYGYSISLLSPSEPRMSIFKNRHPWSEHLQARLVKAHSMSAYTRPLCKQM